MTDAFYITMYKGAQATADALGVNLLFQRVPKFDPERQVNVLDADSLHQVERVLDKTGRSLGDNCRKNAEDARFRLRHSIHWNITSRLANSIFPRP